MRWHWIVGLVLVAAVGLAPARAAAQGKGALEVGYDFGLNVQILDDVDESEMALGLPSQDFGAIGFLSLQTARFGFFVSETVQIEPIVGFAVAEQGDETLTQLGLGIDVAQNFGGREQTSRPYIKAGGKFRMVDIVDESAGQTGLGLAFGTKIRAAERVAVRLEGRASRWFENDDFNGHWDVGASVGLSVFTK